MVEFGRHEELLLVDDSVYKGMWTKQESTLAYFQEVNRHEETFKQP